LPNPEEVASPGGTPRWSMVIDQEKVEQAVLALLYLTSFKDGLGLRAWKGHNWEVMNLLHEKRIISQTRLLRPNLWSLLRRSAALKRAVRETFGLKEG